MTGPWATDWRGGDEDGWVYGESFTLATGDEWDARYVRGLHCVRRRRWVRRQVKLARRNGAPIAADDSKARRSGVDIGSR